MAVRNKLRNLMPGRTADSDADPEPTVHTDQQVHREQGEHLAQLKAHLQIAHLQAGKPTYRSLETLTSRRLSASTISRMFNPERPPKWPKLVILLTALGVPNDDQISIWHPLWAAAVGEASRISDPVSAAQEMLSPRVADGHAPCARCGAVISDPAVHQRWHAKLSEAETLIEALERLSKRPTTRSAPTPAPAPNTPQPRSTAMQARPAHRVSGPKAPPRSGR